MFEFFKNLYDKKTNQFYDLCLSKIIPFNEDCHLSKQGEFEIMILIGHLLAPRNDETWNNYLNKLKDNRKKFEVNLNKKECLEVINKRIVYYNQLLREIKMLGADHDTMGLLWAEIVNIIYENPLEIIPRMSFDMLKIDKIQRLIIQVLKSK